MTGRRARVKFDKFIPLMEHDTRDQLHSAVTLTSRISGTHMTLVRPRNRYDLKYSCIKFEAFAAMKIVSVRLWIMTVCRIYVPQHKWGNNGNSII
jgi:hypothetical protein